ncbi:MAG: hypothetical protein IPP82_02590 [Xanthomonadales bacterium]|nr:hypothetical protein [Xanthomonadales bacterium]
MALLLFAIHLCLPVSVSADTDLLPFDVEPQRETSASSRSPLISFIDSPTAGCYGPLEAIDACYIQWSYLSVSSTSPQYMDRMTVAIDGRIRAVYTGFFQTSMYVPPEMHAPGFKVACGIAGASGDPDSGFHYAYAIRARETGGLSTANYGTAICPADYRIDLIFRDGFE